MTVHARQQRNAFDPATAGTSGVRTLEKQQIDVVLTRIRFHSPLALISAIRRYRRLLREAREIEGFIDSALLFEGVRTLVMLSFWDSIVAQAKFATRAPHHIDAVRWSRTVATARWSAAMRIAAVSGSSRDWRSPGHS